MKSAIKIIQHIIKALQYALKGLQATVTHQFAFQMELVLTLVLLPLGYYWGKTGVERALLIMSWLLVLIIELINSAVETTVDRISREHHQLSGRAKDIASAAVLLSLLNAAAVWFIILSAHYPSGITALVKFW